MQHKSLLYHIATTMKSRLWLKKKKAISPCNSSGLRSIFTSKRKLLDWSTFFDHLPLQRHCFKVRAKEQYLNNIDHGSLVECMRVRRQEFCTAYSFEPGANESSPQSTGNHHPNKILSDPQLCKSHLWPVDSPASSTKQKMSVLFASRCYTCLSLFSIVFLLLVMRLSSSWSSISITASGHGKRLSRASPKQQCTSAPSIHQFCAQDLRLQHCIALPKWSQTIKSTKSSLRWLQVILFPHFVVDW